LISMALIFMAPILARKAGLVVGFRAASYQLAPRAHKRNTALGAPAAAA